VILNAPASRTSSTDEENVTLLWMVALKANVIFKVLIRTGWFELSRMRKAVLLCDLIAIHLDDSAGTSQAPPES